MSDLVDMIDALQSHLLEDGEDIAAEVVSKALDTIQSQAARIKVLEEAATALLDKCEAMAEATKPIFAEMQIVRGRGAYDGPTIGEEMDALRKALKTGGE